MKPIGSGRSSYDLIDPEKLFDELNLESGTVFLDLACGKGEYSVRAAEAVGEAGQVYAVDLWDEGIAALQERIVAPHGFVAFDRIVDVGPHNYLMRFFPAP